jgi:YidC/Oxa1 family membrane protein insertase
MDKNTVIAVVLAVVVIVGGMLIQSVFFPAPKPAVSATAPAQTSETRPTPAPAVEQPVQPAVAPAGTPAPAAAPGEVAPAEQETLQEESYVLETEVFRVKFTNRGGEVTSIQLKKFKNADGTPVEMVFAGNTGLNNFRIHFGDYTAPAVDALFRIEPVFTGTGVSFVRSFAGASGVPFTLRKTYLFKPDDYMIELYIEIENSINEYPELGSKELAYTLDIGPQIGPPFEKLDRRNEFRYYQYYPVGGKKKRDVRIPKDGYTELESNITWAAIVGKYFEVIAVPDSTRYRVTYDTRELQGLKDRSSLYFGRTEVTSSKSKDRFRVYIGPKKREILARYNEADKNAYRLSDQHFEETISTSPLIAWLANILKFFLELFYRLIPNYGVAIILLTILIKVILFPLTHKSFESTARMQALQPKIAELREKYKNNPQKLNQETAALYKKEGVNPLGGCLPLLLQLPIFFALYSLLISHFELRGAMFIPGWIPDLSAPESIWDFSPFTIPFVKWHNLRVLPFVMLLTTFIQSRLTQAPDSSAQNMKLMTYAMPIVFFFILYDMPSGLVLYWTMQNVLTIFQQMYTNYRRKRAEAAGVEEGPGRKGRQPPRRALG